MAKKVKRIEEKFSGIKFVGNLPDAELYRYNGKCYRIPFTYYIDEDGCGCVSPSTVDNLDGYEAQFKDYVQIDKISYLYKDDYESFVEKATKSCVRPFSHYYITTQLGYHWKNRFVTTQIHKSEELRQKLEKK